MKKVVLFSVLALSVAGAFADSIADSSNYTPGGKYRLFGNGRGTVTNLTNYINVSGGLTQQVGNLAISTTAYSGGLSYEMQFHNHGWQVHSPFANEARQEFHSKNGKIAQGGGATLTDLSVTGYQIHPADGYDGEQGGGYPTPTGARDEYLYLVNGKEVSVSIVNPDKVPPKANDDKLLRQAGIDPTPYDKTQSTLADRPDIQRLTLVGENADGGLTGYNGGVENGSADTSTNGNGWGSAETGSPLSLYDGDNANTDPYGVTPYSPKPSLLTGDGEQNGSSVSTSTTTGVNLEAIAGIGLKLNVGVDTDRNITVQGAIIAGPAFGGSASAYAQESVSSKGSPDGVYAQGCGTVKVGGGLSACGGFSQNGGVQGSGTGSVGIGLQGGLYGEFGYAKTF